MSQHPYHPFGSPPQFDRIPPEVQSGSWCVWKARPRPGKAGKVDKIPSNGTNDHLSTKAPDQWLTYNQAKQLYQANPGTYNGVGRLADDQLIYVDVDNDNIRPMADWIDDWPTYCEISPSGNGLHFISLGKVSRDTNSPVEVYSGHAPRFMTITGATYENNTRAVDLAQRIEDEIIALAPAQVTQLDVDMPEMIMPAPGTAQVTFEPGDRSAQMFGLVHRLLNGGMTPGEALGLLWESPDVSAYALDHREGRPDKALQFLWSEVRKAMSGRQESPFQDLSQGQVYQAGDPLAWEDAFVPFQETMDKIGHEEYLYPNLVIKGHLIAIPAPPNGGKTTIFMHLCEQWAREGKVQPVYINADCPAVEAKEYFRRAQAAGFKMLLPDYVDGFSMASLVQSLATMAQQDVDLSSRVYVFDTLKKMVEVIEKKQLKALLDVFRALTARGATVILLAHTNKYKVDGFDMFEGTGDLKADVDELVYFMPYHDEEDHSVTVSTRIDKSRGLRGNTTFRIDANRQVTNTGYQDIADKVEAQMGMRKDKLVIDSIAVALDAGPQVQQDLARTIGDVTGAGRQKIIEVLHRYAGMRWERSQDQAANNRITYHKLGTRLHEAPLTQGGTVAPGAPRQVIPEPEWLR